MILAPSIVKFKAKYNEKVLGMSSFKGNEPQNPAIKIILLIAGLYCIAVTYCLDIF